MASRLARKRQRVDSSSAESDLDLDITLLSGNKVPPSTAAASSRPRRRPRLSLDSSSLSSQPLTESVDDRLDVSEPEHDEQAEQGQADEDDNEQTQDVNGQADVTDEEQSPEAAERQRIWDMFEEEYHDGEQERHCFITPNSSP